MSSSLKIPTTAPICQFRVHEDCWIRAARLDLSFLLDLTGKLAHQADWLKEGRRKMDENRLND